LLQFFIFKSFFILNLNFYFLFEMLIITDFFIWKPFLRFNFCKNVNNNKYLSFFYKIKIKMYFIYHFFFNFFLKFFFFYKYYWNFYIFFLNYENSNYFIQKFKLDPFYKNLNFFFFSEFKKINYIFFYNKKKEVFFLNAQKKKFFIWFFFYRVFVNLIKKSIFLKFFFLLLDFLSLNNSLLSIIRTNIFIKLMS